MEVSRITKRPFGFNTRRISDNPVSKFSKLRTPKATVIASKVLSSKGIFSESARIISILLESFFASILFLPTASIPAEISKPIIFFALVEAIKIAKSPVPVAMSKIDSGLVLVTNSSTFLRHLMSIPKEIIRFSPS